MSAISLSGWGQPHDALSGIAASPVDYARHGSAREALASIAQQARGCDMIIGWSLGGQLAVRAVAAGLVKPRALVLIATPFQFVARGKDSLGMPPDVYGKFRGNYETNPARTLHMAWELVLRGDERHEAVRLHLDRQDRDKVMASDWLYWLSVLESFSCEGLHLADFPPTLLIHGDRDAVVSHAQSEQFARAMPHAKLVTLKGCGHAPHWHDHDRLMQEIAHV